MNGLKLVLYTDDDLLREAWEKEFEGYDSEQVEIFSGQLEDVPACDCLVAEGNSFGIMDGETDTEIRLQFPDVGQNLREVVESAYCGEIPVGQSVIIPTGDQVFRFLAYTPTARFRRNIPTEVVYDATRATLLAVKTHNMADFDDQVIAEDLGEEREQSPIESIAMPGFGISAGVGAFKAARMMRLGVESVLGADDTSYDSWDDVEAYLKKLYSA